MAFWYKTLHKQKQHRIFRTKLPRNSISCEELGSGLINVTIFCLTSADFHFPPPLMRFWVEPAGGEKKSADIEQKTVMLIYLYHMNYN
jgi:hypothetical protein